MPGTRCTVAVCSNSFEKTKRAGMKILYHRFPGVKLVRNIWIERCGRAGKWNPDSCHICSIHFTDDDYIQASPGSLKRLRPTAVPSLFLSEPAPTNVELLTPRKRRKTSLSDKTPLYSNEDNIMNSQSDDFSYFDQLTSYSENFRDDEVLYLELPVIDDLPGIDLKNLQNCYVGKNIKNEKSEAQEDPYHLSSKHSITMTSVATETTPDYFLNDYQRLVNENKKLKSKLAKLNLQHEKLLLNMKFLESKVENLRLSTLIQHL